MAPPSADDVVLLEMMIRGHVVVPGNTREYKAEIQRMHNASFFTRKPAMFILCHDTADVVEAVKFVTKHELPLSIRSGGHSACGSSLNEGTVVIDVGRMRDLSYDPKTELLTLQPGCVLSDINVHLLRNGRMTPVGVAPPTGAGGLCLSGGIGHLLCKYGTSVDQITSIEMVLADGTLKTVDVDSTGDDKELFFAARGAAGTLGVVTRFTMRTYPVEMITGGVWIMEDDANYTATRKLMKLARDMVLEQDAAGNRKLTGSIFPANLPPEPFLPEELHGKPCTLMFAGVFGTDDEAQAMINLFCDRPVIMGKPPAPMPFTVFNQCLSGMMLTFPPFGHYWKGSLVNEFPDDMLDEFVDKWSQHEPIFNGSLVGLDFYGGKGAVEYGSQINEGNDHCCAGLRNFTFAIEVLIYFPPNAGVEEKAKAMARDMVAPLQVHRSACYSNFVDVADLNDHVDLGEELIFSDKMRYQAIKAKVDPKNIFTRNVFKAA